MFIRVREMKYRLQRENERRHVRFNDWEENSLGEFIIKDA